MPMRKLLIFSLFIALMAGCSSTPEEPVPVVNEQAEREQELNEQLQTAIGFANKGHYYVAEDQLKVIANEPRNKTSLRQQALTQLTLLYLNKDNPRANTARATRSLDQLNVLNNGRSGDNTAIFTALGYALEARISLEEAQRKVEESARTQQVLMQEINALQIALDKLRQLSLQ